MKIDTDELKIQVENYEEKLLEIKYKGNWEKCPISFLNSSEKRIIDRMKLIESIENLSKELNK